eukprot:6593184-Ditylum_brightwellii.AAC.1
MACMSSGVHPTLGGGGGEDDIGREESTISVQQEEAKYTKGKHGHPSKPSCSKLIDHNEGHSMRRKPPHLSPMEPLHIVTTY